MNVNLDELYQQIEITCRGQQLLPFLTLQHVRDNVWTTARSEMEIGGGGGGVMNNLNIPLQPPPSSTTTTTTTDPHHLMLLHYGWSSATPPA